MNDNFSPFQRIINKIRHMKKLICLLVSVALGATFASAQKLTELKPVNLSEWDIGTGNYSGITYLGNNRYAIVSDKEPADGFFVFDIKLFPQTGQVLRVSMEGFYGNPSPKIGMDSMSIRDCEGIAYFPKNNSIFISGEGDQEILEYGMNGVPTGRSLAIPSIFALKNIMPNLGFESLGYSATTHRFWTTTESTLPADGYVAGPAHPGVQNLLRIQSFDDNLQPAEQYAYRMDRGRDVDFGKYYVLGVPEITPLPNGKLLIMEREANVTRGYMGSEVTNRLFLVDAKQSWLIGSDTKLSTLDNNKFMVKKLLLSFTTSVNPFRQTYANYEGMCLGPDLPDGRHTLLMICDSQASFGNKLYHLRDYLKVIVLPANMF